MVHEALTDGSGFAFDETGTSIAAAGDLNGDGFDDLAVGAFGSDGPGAARTDAGGAYPLFGQAGPTPAHIDIAGAAWGAAAWGLDGMVTLGADAAAQSSVQLSGAGDIDGDG